MKNKAIPSVFIAFMLIFIYSCKNNTKNLESIKNTNNSDFFCSNSQEEQFPPIIIEPHTSTLPYIDYDYEFTVQTLLYNYEPYYMYTGENFREKYTPKMNYWFDEPSFEPEAPIFRDMSNLYSRE